MKIIIISDSNGLPRDFENDKNKVENHETFPNLLKKNKNLDIVHICIPGETTKKLIDTLNTYYSSFNPDFIFIYSGINDARPEAFSNLEKKIFSLFENFLIFSRLYIFYRKALLSPSMIKRRSKVRVSISNFKKVLKNLKLNFENSNIFYFEISVCNGYEKNRPGVIEKAKIYSDIINEIFENNFIKIKKELNEREAFNSDNLHLNKIGHKIIFDKISSIIKI